MKILDAWITLFDNAIINFILNDQDDLKIDRSSKGVNKTDILSPSYESIQAEDVTGRTW
jgi:hypothetical protein